MAENKEEEEEGVEEGECLVGKEVMEILEEVEQPQGQKTSDQMTAGKFPATEPMGLQRLVKMVVELDYDEYWTY